MCTVVLHLAADGSLELTMNRDERWDREAELPPTHHPAAEGRPAWLGPLDGERGGTWIGVNEAGAAACILNGYAPGDLELLGRSGIPSRGEIIPGALTSRPGDLFAWADHELRPDRYPSFVLVLAAGGGARCLRWLLDRGVERSDLCEGWNMVTSSMWRPREVTEWRERAFERWLAAGAPHRGPVPELNLLADRDAPRHSPFMTRPMSATRSITRISVEPRRERAVMHYWRRRGDSMIDAERPDAVRELPLGFI